MAEFRSRFSFVTMTAITAACVLSALGFSHGCASDAEQAESPREAALSSVASEREAGVMPTVTWPDLNGKKYTLPAELPGNRSLVFIAFVQQHQTSVDTWIDGLRLRGAGADRLPWLELPVIENRGSIFRWYVDNGMRSGIKKAEARAKVVTLYETPKKFIGPMGLSATDRIYAVVVERSGKVIAVEEGRYDDEKAQRILTALGESVARNPFTAE